jgi:hypothetical protein
VRRLVAGIAVVAVLAGVSAGTALPRAVWGYIGCSNTHDAVYGYSKLSAEQRFWPYERDYRIEGATVHDWADRGSPYWHLVRREIERHGAPTLIWFQACAQLDPREPGYRPLSQRDLKRAIDNIQALVPTATVFVSPLQDYQPATLCPMMGLGAPEIPTVSRWLSRLVARGEVRAGPGVNDQPDLGPLTRNGTVWRDGCHPTGDPLHPASFKGSGAQLLGAQLVASFDSLPIDPP